LQKKTVPAGTRDAGTTRARAIFVRNFSCGRGEKEFSLTASFRRAFPQEAKKIF